MKLEELVPPVELCKLIPAGEFEDSAFCYINASNFTGERDEYFEVIEMKIYNGFAYKPEKYPAPTFDEVLDELPILEIDEGLLYTVDRATCALKLWLKQKGIINE